VGCLTRVTPQIYFGKKFQNRQRIARYVDSFYQGGDMWLVFVDEGISLQQFLYVMRHSTSSGGAEQTPFLEPSLFWLRLRTTEQGKEVMRALLLQLVQAVNEMQQGGERIVHRDIKPSNLLINSEVLALKLGTHLSPPPFGWR
jgi:serine/threonine protein kinase